MPRKPPTWPEAALPRLLDAPCAAYYVGLSPGSFRKRVECGKYPRPKQDGARMLWDRHQLDRAIDGPGTAHHRGLSADYIDPDEEAKALAALRE